MPNRDRLLDTVGWLLASAVIAAVIVVASCGGPTATPGPSEQAASAIAAAEKTLPGRKAVPDGGGLAGRVTARSSPEDGTVPGDRASYGAQVPQPLDLNPRSEARMVATAGPPPK